jgi:hypothetical protein
MTPTLAHQAAEDLAVDDGDERSGFGETHVDHGKCPGQGRAPRGDDALLEQRQLADPLGADLLDPLRYSVPQPRDQPPRMYPVE